MHTVTTAFIQTHHISTCLPTNPAENGSHLDSDFWAVKHDNSRYLSGHHRQKRHTIRLTNGNQEIDANCMHTCRTYKAFFPLFAAVRMSSCSDFDTTKTCSIGLRITFAQALFTCPRGAWLSISPLKVITECLFEVNQSLDCAFPKVV